MKWSFKIGSILGIPLKVHITFLLLLVLVYLAGASVIGIGGLSGVVLVVLVFASVVFHEMSHSLVARHFGIPVEDITLLPIGGISRMTKTPDKPSEEIFIAIVGPLSSLVLAFALWFAARLIGVDVTVTDLSVKGGILPQLAAINFLLAIFNLLPAFPMDGGRVSARHFRTLSEPLHGDAGCRRSRPGVCHWVVFSGTVYHELLHDSHRTLCVFGSRSGRAPNDDIAVSWWSDCGHSDDNRPGEALTGRDRRPCSGNLLPQLPARFPCDGGFAIDRTAHPRADHRNST